MLSFSAVERVGKNEYTISCYMNVAVPLHEERESNP